MPDQNNQNPEQKPPEQAGDSFALWEGEGKPTEQASAPVTPPQELPPEPSDPRERSQLGRKVAEMERSFSQVSENINRLTQLMAEREAYQEPYRREETRYGRDPYDREPREEDIYDAPVNTYRDIKEREAMERKITARHEEAYVSNYVRRVKSLGIGANADPELHREIERELLQDGYQKYYRATNHPLKDAEINYNIAKAAVLERRYREVTNRPNVMGDKQNPPSGMTSAGRMPSPPQNTEGLDDYAKKFVSAVGAKETDEWVQNAVKRKDR